MNNTKRNKSIQSDTMYNATYIALILLSIMLLGCATNKEPSIERWYCYATHDWKANKVLNESLRGKSKVYLTRPKERNLTSSPGTISVAGVTYDASYELRGTARVRFYSNQDREYAFMILLNGQGSSAIQKVDGSFDTIDANLMCESD